MSRNVPPDLQLEHSPHRAQSTHMVLLFSRTQPSPGLLSNSSSNLLKTTRVVQQMILCPPLGGSVCTCVAFVFCSDQLHSNSTQRESVHRGHFHFLGKAADRNAQRTRVHNSAKAAAYFSLESFHPPAIYGCDDRRL